MTALFPVPPSWAWTTLGEIADVVGGVTKDSKKQANPAFPQVPYLRVANVQRGYLDLREITKIRVPEPIVTKLRLQPSDVLLNEGGDRDKLGRGWVWDGQIQDCIHQNHVFRARLADGTLHPKLLAWYANETARSWFEENASQSVNLASISLSTIKRLPIPLPPHDEQARILTVLEDHLSRIDAAQSYMNHASAAVASWRASLRASEVVGAGSEPKVGADLQIGWTWGQLGDIVDGIEAGKSFRCEPRPATRDEWGVIKVSAMTWGQFREEENKAVPRDRSIDRRHEIRPGDVLVSRANTERYVGAPVLVGTCRRKLLLSDKSLRLLPKPWINREWLVQVLASPLVRRQISTKATGNQASMRNISQQGLRQIVIPIPPKRDQAIIADRLSVRLHEISYQETKVDLVRRRANSLRRALLTLAFSGRLAPQDPRDEPAEFLLERTRANRSTQSRARRTGEIDSFQEALL